MNLSKKEKYVSALRYNWLTALYDPIMRWTLRENTFKTQLIKQSKINSGHRVLDLGCGSATLTILIKQMHPEAEVIGLDGDVTILEIAQRKVTASGMDIELKTGMSFEIDLPDNSVDRVLSSLLFHHLTTENKCRTFAEVHRILKPGGELHIADWGKPKNPMVRSSFFIVQLLDGFTTTNDNVQGKLTDYIQEAGFRNVIESKRFITVFGSLSLYGAVKI